MENSIPYFSNCQDFLIKLYHGEKYRLQVWADQQKVEKDEVNDDGDIVNTFW